MPSPDTKKVSLDTHFFIVFFNIFYAYLLYDYFSDGIIGYGGITRAKITLAGTDALVWIVGFFIFTAVTDIIYLRVIIQSSARGRLRTDAIRQVAIKIQNVSKILKIHRHKIILGLIYFSFWYSILILVTASRLEGFSISGLTLLIYIYYGWALHLTFSYIASSTIFVLGDKFEREDHHDTIRNRTIRNARLGWLVLGILIMAISIWLEFPSGT